jgi:hypothetical protein
MSTRLDDWCETYTGKHFWPLDPKPEEVSIDDIAHALSLTCRYNGHCKHFYCPTVDERILTADLRWVRAGELVAGDRILGFDEYAIGDMKRKKRKLRPAFIVEAAPFMGRTIRLEMSDGSTIKSSPEHPWLVATKVSRNQKWVTASQIAQDISLGRKRYIHRFLVPWDTDSSYNSGWLAGICDGEGSISFKNRQGFQCGVSQKQGHILDRMRTMLDHFGFQYGQSFAGHHLEGAGVVNLQIQGGWREILRLLGTVRPIRLLDNFQEGLAYGGKELAGLGEPIEIVGAYDDGVQDLMGIETSTHTYICEGYGAHNSVGQHSILCAILARINHFNPRIQLLALLHDAGEAYVSDVTRPIKPYLKGYQDMEDRIHRTILCALDIPGAYPIEADCINEIDNEMLTTEAKILMPYVGWSNLGYDPRTDIPIVERRPAAVEEEFKVFLEQLMRDARDVMPADGYSACLMPI